MNEEQLHELAPLYAIGALDDREVAEFEAHLPGCGRCRQDVREYQEAMTTAVESDVDPAATPPPDLRRRILDTVAETPQLDRTESSDPARPTPVTTAAAGEPPVIALADRRRRIERRVLAAAAAVVIVVGGAFLGSRLGDDDPVELVADAPDAETLELEGDVGALTVVYSPSLDQVALIGDGLSDPGEGKVYELWFVTADGVSAAALFEPESGSIREVFTVDDRDGSAGFGVTIEPEGGSEQPTSDILLVGTFET